MVHTLCSDTRILIWPCRLFHITFSDNRTIHCLVLGAHCLGMDVIVSSDLLLFNVTNYKGILEWFSNFPPHSDGIPRHSPHDHVTPQHIITVSPIHGISESQLIVVIPGFPVSVATAVPAIPVAVVTVAPLLSGVVMVIIVVQSSRSSSYSLLSLSS